MLAVFKSAGADSPCAATMIVTMMVLSLLQNVCCFRI